MPRLLHVEMRISMIEGFEVEFKQNGRNVRDDKEKIPQWPYQRQSKNDMTVGEWKQKFGGKYPGYDVNVLDGNGNPVTGQMKLGTVRDSYDTGDEDR